MNLSHRLPEVFLERIREIIPEKFLEAVLKSFSAPKRVALRVNTLKTTRQEIRDILIQRDIVYEGVDWCDLAFVLDRDFLEHLRDCLAAGELYQQNLSSILVSLILDPRPGERVLDLCAAPGSKATHIAAMMENTGELVCVEVVRERYYKLRSVMDMMGVAHATFKRMDGRRLYPARRDRDPAGALFDKVLVDAPCSSEGRFHLSEPGSAAYWSLRKIKEMAHKQKGLLKSAGRWVKDGGIIVYTTCTFAPEENEEVLDWFLRQGGFRLLPLDVPTIQTYPPVMAWKHKRYHPHLTEAMRILPNERMDGFFIALLQKTVSCKRGD